MRCLHVIDSLRPTPHGCALLALLKVHHGLPGGADDTHDVLAFERGELDTDLGSVARRVFVAGGGVTVAAVVHARAYDVVHTLDATAALQVAPLVVGGSMGAFVHSGRSLAGDRSTAGAWDAAILMAADLVIVDPRDTALDRHLDVGGHLARLDLARVAALAAADGEVVSPSRLPQYTLREWLALVSQPRVSTHAAA